MEEARSRLDELSDQRLVSRVCQDDAAAFSVIYDRYVGPVYALAAYMLDPQEAEDVVKVAMNDFDVFGKPQEMNCQQIQDQLEDFLFGALDREEHARFEHHHQRCPNCRRIYDLYEEVIHKLPHALAAAS